MKLTSHSVAVPPLTDIQEMMGAYKGLFDMLNLPNTMPFAASSGFTHPIPEENEKLTGEFFNAMMTVKQLMIDRISVKLHDTRINSHMITFVFSYEES